MTDSNDQESSSTTSEHGPGSDVNGGSATSRPLWRLGSRSIDTLGLGLAWALVLVGVVLWNVKPGAELVDPMEANPSDLPAGQLVGSQEELAGRLGFGFLHLIPGFPAESQVAALEQGSPAAQIARAIFIAGASSIEEGVDALNLVVENNPEDPVVMELAPLVSTCFASAEAGEHPSDEISGAIEERLGWFGLLAVDLGDQERMAVIADRATRDALLMMLLLGVMGGAGLLGFIGLGVLIALTISKRLSIRVPTPDRHGVYAETFAGWLLLMLLLQFVMAALSRPGLGLLMSVVAFFGSLIALAWPVIRGIPWAEVRNDIGLTAPRWSDLPTGIASWAMALPFLVVGGIITVVLMVVTQFLTGATPTPSHPAQQAAMDADAWQVIQLFLLASVAAPVVEEIMFRGVFFTHLCGWTRRWSRWLGIIFAVFVSSVIFAAIHPQGPIFIPPLAGLAIGFCVARLWRGSLIPAMVAHGVSNALVMGLNVMLFSS